MKSERFEMRLDPQILENVDAWRGKQDDIPTRAEAIRRLTEQGLSVSEKRSVRFSEGEKLITLMLCELYEHLKVKGEINPSFIKQVIYGGHYWSLPWELTGVFYDHEDKESVVAEVVDILDMWSFIESSYKKLSKKDKDRIKTETQYDDLLFAGFDANNEPQYI